jgi:hypothetical protein
MQTAFPLTVCLPLPNGSYRRKSSPGVLGELRVSAVDSGYSKQVPGWIFSSKKRSLSKLRPLTV